MESQILVGLAKWERMAWTCTHSLGPISWASQKPSNVGSLSFPLTYTAPFFAKGFFLLAITKDSGSSKTIFDQNVHFGNQKGIDWLDFIRNLIIRGLVLTGYMAGNGLARVQRVHEPADLWDITFCTRPRHLLILRLLVLCAPAAPMLTHSLPWWG